MMFINKSVFKKTLMRIKRRGQDIKNQENFAKMRIMTTLEFYSRIKRIWSKEDYVDEGDNKIREGWSWFRLGVWRSRGMRKNFEKDKCPLCLEREDEFHIMLGCNKTKEIRKNYIEDKILRLSLELGLMKILKERNRTQIRKVGLMLFRIKKEWVKEIERYEIE